MPQFQPPNDRPTTLNTYYRPDPNHPVCGALLSSLLSASVAAEEPRGPIRVVVGNIGKGQVFYYRPGHEKYPIFKQDVPLKILENAVRWLGI